MRPPTYPNSWELTDDGRWIHRPWFKVVINRVLRFFQPGPVKWVVYTRCDQTLPGSPTPPEVRGYGFGPILHTR